MKKINNVAELRQLTPGQKFYKIKEGDIDPFIYAGPHPKSEGIAIAIKDSNWLTPVCISKSSFVGAVFVFEEYNSKEIGEYKTIQLEAKIALVNEIHNKNT